MDRVPALQARVDESGVVTVVLKNGRMIEVIFDEFGIPHAGRVLTTTAGRHIIEMILPYEVRIIGTTDGSAI